MSCFVGTVVIRKVGFFMCNAYLWDAALHLDIHNVHPKKDEKGFQRLIFFVHSGVSRDYMCSTSTRTSWRNSSRAVWT